MPATAGSLNKTSMSSRRQTSQVGQSPTRGSPSASPSAGATAARHRGRGVNRFSPGADQGLISQAGAPDSDADDEDDLSLSDEGYDLDVLTPTEVKANVLALRAQELRDLAKWLSIRFQAWRTDKKAWKFHAKNVLQDHIMEAFGEFPNYVRLALACYTHESQQQNPGMTDEFHRDRDLLEDITKDGKLTDKFNSDGFITEDLLFDQDGDSLRGCYSVVSGNAPGKFSLRPASDSAAIGQGLAGSQVTIANQQQIAELSQQIADLKEVVTDSGDLETRLLAGEVPISGSSHSDSERRDATSYILTNKAFIPAAARAPRRQDTPNLFAGAADMHVDEQRKLIRNLLFASDLKKVAATRIQRRFPAPNVWVLPPNTTANDKVLYSPQQLKTDNALRAEQLTLMPLVKAIFINIHDTNIVYDNALNVFKDEQATANTAADATAKGRTDLQDGSKEDVEFHLREQMLEQLDNLETMIFRVADSFHLLCIKLSSFQRERDQLRLTVLSANEGAILLDTRSTMDPAAWQMGQEDGPMGMDQVAAQAAAMRRDQIELLTIQQAKKPSRWTTPTTVQRTNVV